MRKNTDISSLNVQGHIQKSYETQDNYLLGRTVLGVVGVQHPWLPTKC